MRGLRLCCLWGSIWGRLCGDAMQLAVWASVFQIGFLFQVKYIKFEDR